MHKMWYYDIMFRGWAFLAPALVMIVVGIIIFFFLVTGEN